MPQFDITTYSSQIFWLVLSFSTLIAILKWFLLPRFNAIILKREEKMKSDMAKAEQLQQQLEKKQVQRMQQLEKAHAKANKLIYQTMKELEQYEEEQLNQLHQRIKTQLVQFEKDLYQERKNLEDDIEILVKQSIDQLLPKILGVEMPFKNLGD